MLCFSRDGSRGAVRDGGTHICLSVFAAVNLPVRISIPVAGAHTIGYIFVSVFQMAFF